MASSTLIGNLEVDVEIKASPEQFREMFAHKLHHVHHTCYDKVQGCDLHKDEKAKNAKVIEEAVDSNKNLVTFKMIEGDLMKEYKSSIVTIQVSPKCEGNGSIMH
ncbi:MLP-like protein 28 [Gossypium hirsutum]|uniref:MLP-like protein 28 n=1 Tax=Gossypium hirsutum TaxID=3635 RepID=A0ABM2ZNQ5_GOSHI|nr:MLP-like protein 28 [Gossypium hirsutum]